MSSTSNFNILPVGLMIDGWGKQEVIDIKQYLVLLGWYGNLILPSLSGCKHLDQRCWQRGRIKSRPSYILCDVNEFAFLNLPNFSLSVNKPLAHWGGWCRICLRRIILDIGMMNRNKKCWTFGRDCCLDYNMDEGWNENLNAFLTGN